MLSVPSAQSSREGITGQQLELINLVFFSGVLAVMDFRRFFSLLMVFPRLSTKTMVEFYVKTFSWTMVLLTFINLIIVVFIWCWRQNLRPFKCQAKILSLNYIISLNCVCLCLESPSRLSQIVRLPLWKNVSNSGKLSRMLLCSGSHSL